MTARSATHARLVVGLAVGGLVATSCSGGPSGTASSSPATETATRDDGSTTPDTVSDDVADASTPDTRRTG